MITHPFGPPRDEQGRLLARLSATSAEEALWQALEGVLDPELPVSVVDLGLIYGLRRSGPPGAEHVQVLLTFTAMGCPCMDFILEDVRARLLEEPGVIQVDLEIVWDPPWTRQRLSARGAERLKRLGITV